MTDGHDVLIEVDQNPYLAAGVRQVNAIVTVDVGGAPAGSRPPTVAQVLIIDGSASMAYPHTKLPEAKRALAAAIGALRDDTAFAVVVGTHTAEPVYPAGGGMAAATARTRQEALRAVDALTADGHTRIGRWLTFAAELLAAQPADIRHVVLLTDGRNTDEHQDELRDALRACAGAFVCDCRGIGRDWKGEELLMIADALNGSADAVTDLHALAGDFQAITEKVMGKVLPDLAIRLWTPTGSKVRFVNQVHPRILDLTDRRTDVEPRVGEYPLGTWGAERRDYHVCVDVEPGDVGDEMLAGRISVVRGDRVYAEERILAIWTADEERSTGVSERVQHYTAQTELADEIQGFTVARREGDEALALARLRRAVQLADESGDAATARSLERLVDVDDERGTVRLVRRPGDADADLAVEVVTVRRTQTVREPGAAARRDAGR
ncbi:VWA domain-containing protein [Dactylosporangium siamense]|uniref:VWA domain-containing protein n=1 Tax=Dactylosporangium siamense TaxID=685454 RepID=A0A919Q152_9ACTN|nr:VWA domain-containing protein [Dactylosporangium siamense]GIG51995.1 VWA domain-containing protein [Dactylosporangium siamense]